MRENRSSFKISSMHILLLSFNFQKDSVLRVSLSINIYTMPVITEVFTFNMFSSFFIRTIEIKYLPAGKSGPSFCTFPHMVAAFVLLP